MFRFKTSIPVSYEEQGYIYFTSLLYKSMPLATQKKIKSLCAVAGGEYREALFAFVTTQVGATEVCAKYYLSQSTLERIVRKYYMAFSESL